LAVIITPRNLCTLPLALIVASNELSGNEHLAEVHRLNVGNGLPALSVLSLGRFRHLKCRFLPWHHREFPW